MEPQRRRCQSRDLTCSEVGRYGPPPRQTRGASSERLGDYGHRLSRLASHGRPREGAGGLLRGV